MISHVKLPNIQETPFFFIFLGSLSGYGQQTRRHEMAGSKTRSGEKNVF
jgi:hypothetical protein